MRERRNFLTLFSLDLYTLVSLQKYLWGFYQPKAKHVLQCVSFSGPLGNVESPDTAGFLLLLLPVISLCLLLFCLACFRSSWACNQIF